MPFSPAYHSMIHAGLPIVSALQTSYQQSRLAKGLLGRPCLDHANRSRQTRLAVAAEIRRIESRLADLPEVAFRDRAKFVFDSACSQTPNTDNRVRWAGVIAEAVFRTHGFRMHDVQVQAMVAGAAGAIVEMQTGEGKTVVTGATAAMQVLGARSVHVGTTNTYLAARDLEEMADTFDLLGLTFGLLPEQNNESASRRAYRQQIVYGPGYQYGFDYLRDQLYLRRNRQTALGVSLASRIRGQSVDQSLIQPPNCHDIALIDEADSVMIDEAMTPLVISEPGAEADDPTPYLLAKQITDEFVQDIDYAVERPAGTIELTASALQRGHEAIDSIRDLQLARPWRSYLSNAICARERFKRDVDYVVRDGEVQIVDQYTGRIFADRTWQNGLHQAVEAKEQLTIQPGRESTTQITRQRYLQYYKQLSGLTGTAASVATEFENIYRCNVVEIPTHRKSLRRIERTRFFASLEAKLSAVTAEVIKRHQVGQPILLGTQTIRESYQVQEALQSQGIQATLLNGVQDQEEAEIVSRAGKFRSVTIATNMAGRGTDIKLDSQSLNAGGLHVIGFSHNAAGRVDRQLIGRSARQGKPGSAQFFAAATDCVFEENSPAFQNAIRRHAKTDGESKDFSRELEKLQHKIETRNYRQREAMILRDRWMDTVREAIEK